MVIANSASGSGKRFRILLSELWRIAVLSLDECSWEDIRLVTSMLRLKARIRTDLLKDDLIVYKSDCMNKRERSKSPIS
jgi:hypothetical protein